MKSNYLRGIAKGIAFSFMLLLFAVSCSEKEEELIPLPKAEFSFSPITPTAKEEVTFNNTSSNATSYQWSAEGTNFNSTEKNPKFTFDKAGNFVIKLVAKNTAGTNEITKKITVNPTTQVKPTAAFSFSPSSPKTGEEVTFTNQSKGATSYQWSAEGTNFSSTEENPKFTFDTAGTFKVKLIAKSDAGTSELVKDITVAQTQQKPTAAFNFSPDSPKTGEEVTFTNESKGATSYQWSAEGTNFNSTEENPKFTFDTEGTFKVKLIAKNDVGTSEVIKDVTVAQAQQKPTAAFSFSPDSPKTGEEVTFTNESKGATSYQWSAEGTNFNSTEENPKFTFDTEGTFKVKLIAKNDAGTSEVIKDVTVSKSSTNGNTNNNDCNLPECYVLQTTSTVSGFSTTIKYGYTTVNGKKLISSITTSTGFGNDVVVTMQYDAQGKRIKDETKSGGTLQAYTEYEYSNGDKTVKSTTYDASGTSTGHIINKYDANMKLIRTEVYSASGSLTGYSVFSEFLNKTGSFPQFVESFDANNNKTGTIRHTYQNCQLIKTVSKDGNGDIVGEINNTIDSQGLLRKSVSNIKTQGVTITSTTDYVYDCD